MILKLSFEAELNRLEQELARMGSLTQIALQDAMKAVLERRDDLADAVISGDDEIDECDLRIENGCMNLLVLQQPLAKDLRIVGSISKIITDLERIGDHAVDIAKIAKILNGMPPFEINSLFPKC